MTFSVTSGTTGDGRTPPPGTRVECGTLAEGTFMTSRTNRFTHPLAKATAVAAVCALAVAACSSSKKAAAPASSAASTPAASGAATTSASSAPTTAASAPASSAAGGQLNGGKPVTLTWWHNASTDPGKTAFQKVADDFHAANPNVTIQVQPIQNESIKTKVQVALQGTPPDIFQQWGGGAEATQAQSGKLADLTQLTSSWIGQLGKSDSG